MRAGKATHRPYIPGVAVDNARKGFFEPAEFEAVEQKLPESLRPFVRFLYLTGWRAGEALGLTWAGVDFAASVVRLEPGVTKIEKGESFRSRRFRLWPSYWGNSASARLRWNANRAASLLRCFIATGARSVHMPERGMLRAKPLVSRAGWSTICGARQFAV